MALVCGELKQDLDALLSLLHCRTPTAWLNAAVQRLDELLLDHANCEKKAASTALSLLYRGDLDAEFRQQLSRLAREELRHYEQVLEVMTDRGIAYRELSPSRYAGTLRAWVSTSEPHRFVDTLLVCAVVEARSCERFAALTAVLDPELGRFYGKLLASEARHFELYLNAAKMQAMACGLSQTRVAERLAEVLRLDAELVLKVDSELRFHSGPPADDRLL